MSKSFRIWLSCVLSIVLLWGVAVPVGAEEMRAAMIVPETVRTASDETQSSSETVLCSGFEEAVAALRERMEKRQIVISVSFPDESDDSQRLMDVLNAALVHTGVPTQGDYLRWHLKRCTTSFSAQEQDSGYLLTMTYTFTYHSSDEQEAQMDAAVKTLLDQLDVYTASDYKKVCAIYDYICGNVSYDSWGVMIGDPLIYTAYAALIRKSAVCQGYASLFYRLALELGVDARVIAGTSKNRSHGWNIVRLEDRYYNVDSTWDSENETAYRYFLLCEASFGEHTRKADYTTQEFLSVYPMAEADYAETHKIQKGDLDSSGQVDEDDAICLLQHVLLPEDFPLEQSADYTGDGQVNEEDAVYLLQYVLLPEYFPL